MRLSVSDAVSSAGSVVVFLGKTLQSRSALLLLPEQKNKWLPANSKGILTKFWGGSRWVGLPAID